MQAPGHSWLAVVASSDKLAFEEPRVEPYAKTSLTITYDCPACGAPSTAVVSELTDPTTLMSGADAALVGKERLDDLLVSFAREELRFATCPRCGARNPEGIAAAKTEDWRTRWIGAVAFVAVGIGAWFVNGVAWFAPGLAGLIHAFTVLRVRPLPWKLVVMNTAFLAGLVALAVVLPRACAVLLVIQGLRMAIWRGKGEERWVRAAEKIRFSGPYR